MSDNPASASTLLVTGGSGYLGREILARLSRTDAPQCASRSRVHTTWYANAVTPPDGMTAHRIDLRDAGAIDDLIDIVRPDVVLHTAGSNRTRASLESIEPAARHLAEHAARDSFRLIHMSTDLVFDGESAPYTEDSSPAPLNEYGEAKAAAEAAIRERTAAAVIVRTSLIYGIDPPDHQTRWLLDGVRSGDDITLFTDEMRCPIWVTNLADALIELSHHDYRGTLNLVGPESLDRFTFGHAILDMLGVQDRASIRPTTIADSGLVRPRDLTLDDSLARSMLATDLLSVADVARRHSA